MGVCVHPERVTHGSRTFPNRRVCDLSCRFQSGISDLTCVVGTHLYQYGEFSCLCLLPVPHVVPEDSVVWNASSVLTSSERLALDLSIHLRRLACHSNTSMAVHRPSVFNPEATIAFYLGSQAVTFPLHLSDSHNDENESYCHRGTHFFA